MAESPVVTAVDGVDVEQLRRIFRLLRDKLPRVMEANRFFEEQTGLHNEAGANNLVDALSHLATIVENAEQLGPDGQQEQVAHLEDHLRRSMMEGFEQVAKQQIGDIADTWRIYAGLVGDRTLEAGDPRGLVTFDEMEAARRQIIELMNLGRSSKRDIDWIAWEEGANALAEACELSGELMRRLDTSIAILEARKAHSRQRLATATAIAASVVATVVAVLAIILG